jgi:hypothetical protein
MPSFDVLLSGALLLHLLLLSGAPFSAALLTGALLLLHHKIFISSLILCSRISFLYVQEIHQIKNRTKQTLAQKCNRPNTNACDFVYVIFRGCWLQFTCLVLQAPVNSSPHSPIVVVPFIFNYN